MSIPRWILYLPLGWYVLVPLVLTLVQGQTWSQDTFARLLLAQPLPSAVPLAWWFEFARPLFEQSGGYFAFYSLGRFWLPSVLAISAAFIWWGMIRLTQALRIEMFSRQDARFALLAALLVGWPRIIVFIPLFIICMIISIVFHMVRSTVPTSVFMPLAFATLGTLLSVFLFTLVI